MAIPYKTRKFYGRIFRFLLILLVFVLIATICWVLWLRRFVIYTDEGVKLDFQLSQQLPQGQTSQPENTIRPPEIYFSQPAETKPPVEDQTAQFQGYYVTVEELQTDLEAVLQKIQSLPENTPVMVDVKGYWGYFYYSSQLGSSSSSFNMAVMDAFFAAVRDSGAYTIARLPAFRDYDFADKNLQSGLKDDRGYLWVDPDRCYWLDPASDAVLTYLIQICKELRDLGFDEVSFLNFCFPDTKEVVYEKDREEVLKNAAQNLVSTCTTANFVVSFITTDPAFPLPEGNCRLYLQNVAAADVQTVLTLMEPGVQERTVFFTTSNDTRYQVCGIIQPLIMAD